MKRYKPYFHEPSGIEFKNFQQVREYIWNTREHISELSGKPLLYPNHPQWIWQFAHLLNRHHTYYILNPDNTLLITVDEHKNQEQYPEFIKRQDAIRREYLERYSGKEF